MFTGNLRRICYYSGAIFWLCLDNFNISFSNIFSLDNTVFESLECKDEQVNVIENYDIKDLLIKSLNYKKKNIDDFISHSKYYECDGKICGYDPMNTYRYNDYLYCKYFIFLNENDNIYPIFEEVVLLLKENSLNEIKGYYKR